MSFRLSKDTKILVAGASGMVGSAIVRLLRAREYSRVLAPPRRELDLLNQAQVHEYFKRERPEAVFFTAARVGGILANSTYSADFLYENLVLATNAIHAAAEHGAQKLLYMGSSCIYPKFAPQPMPESSLLTGPLEPTNEAYAIAKIAGLKLCQHYSRQYGKLFISVMPTNLYGPGDNFHPQNSHVIPGMMRRFHEAKVGGAPAVTVWGTGQPMREFLEVDDLADGLLFLMDRYHEADPINIGTAQELSIRELADLMKKVTSYTGQIEFDPRKPDGTPRKLLDISRIRKLGWQPRQQLEAGLRKAYAWALEHKKFD